MLARRWEVRSNSSSCTSAFEQERPRQADVSASIARLYLSGLSLKDKGLPERHRHHAAAAFVYDLYPVIQIQMALANRLADQRPGVLDRPFAGRGEIGLFTAFFVNGDVVVEDVEKITWHPARMRGRRLSFPA